jgi:hypothetical protein
MKGTRWYEVPDRTAQLTIEVGGPLSIREHLVAMPNGPLTARTLTAAFRDFYEERLVRGRTKHAGA